MMQRILFGGLALLVVFALPALGAGKNSGGAMLVHTDDAHTWTNAVCDSFDEWVPGDYTTLNTRTDVDVNTPALIWFIAAFHETATPGVTVIYFGHDHNMPADYHNRLGPCGPAGTLEFPDGGWPDAPTTAGNSVAFGSPVVGDILFPFCYFDVWGEAGWYYASAINPLGGYAGFIDDSNPPVEDQIDNFGRVEWHADGGYNDAPDPPTYGACCFDDGTCQFLQERDCSDLDGIYGGDDIGCDPNPCGVCCWWNNQGGTDYRKCVMTTESDCYYVGTGGDDEGYNFITIEVAEEPIGSEWIGDAVCSDDPEVSWYCSDPRYDTAACCNEDGTCEALAWENCRGAGQSWGYTVDCDPNPCPNGVDPEGACCDHLGACTVTTEAGCEEPDQWQGAETVCDPNPCIPFGVCCVPEPPWVCTITREVDCPEDSIWDGAYWVCDPNPCHQIPTESMSWGKLKTLYR